LVFGFVIVHRSGRLEVEKRQGRDEGHEFHELTRMDANSGDWARGVRPSRSRQAGSLRYSRLGNLRYDRLRTHMCVSCVTIPWVFAATALRPR
jgi:hypothetical protein